MNEQYEKSLTKLELDKVLAMLSDHAASQAAKDRCLAVRPSFGRDKRGLRLHHGQGLAVLRRII